MPPAILALIVTIVEEAIKVAPSFAVAMKTIFTKDNPTPADFAALRAAVASESYAQFVPASDLPAAAAPEPPVPTAAAPSNVITLNVATKPVPAAS